MAPDSTPYSLRPFEDLIDALTTKGRASARALRGPRRKVGATLRAGTATPLWNQLVREILPFLKVRGEKARLAHLLGVHRQAVNEYFVSRSRMPDAERVLLLREWVQVRQAGKRPGW
ncbi:MAG: hypothetical protein PSW75_11370 [bacterium]|nr:hypothetical protein [bacterium]MDI1336948.1 hypothetical protein [Lacunisphaera sp.]